MGSKSGCSFLFALTLAERPHILNNKPRESPEIVRSRNIKPGIVENSFLGSGDIHIQFLFACLPMLANRDGILKDDPLWIKALIFPYRDKIDVNGYLTVLARSTFIIRYEVGKKRYIKITNFKEHQHPHHTEKGVVLPDVTEATVNYPLDNGENPDDSLIPDSSNILTNARKKKIEKPSISLDELSTDHIREWLAKKRGSGKYLYHDEDMVLEGFKDYCRSNGVTYKDYTAALRNAFAWERFQPKPENQNGQQKSKFQIGIEGIAAARAKRMQQQPGPT